MKRVVTALMGLMFSVAALTTANANAGKAACDKACRSYHGADGTPNPKIASLMKVKMRHIGAKEVQALTDPEHERIITDGKGKMKPIKTISGADIDNVVAYVRTLKQ
jgi:hypothetical protein